MSFDCKRIWEFSYSSQGSVQDTVQKFSYSNLGKSCLYRPCIVHRGMVMLEQVGLLVNEGKL